MSRVFTDGGLIVMAVICLGLAGAVYTVFTRDKREDPGDPEEWTAPLRNGSSGVARRLAAEFRAQGRMLPKRSSTKTRKLAAATSRKPARQPAAARTVHGLRYEGRHGQPRSATAGATRSQDGATR